MDGLYLRVHLTKAFRSKRCYAHLLANYVIVKWNITTAEQENSLAYPIEKAGKGRVEKRTVVSLVKEYEDSVKWRGKWIFTEGPWAWSNVCPKLSFQFNDCSRKWQVKVWGLCWEKQFWLAFSLNHNLLKTKNVLSYSAERLAEGGASCPGQYSTKWLH